jgi:hypothetical protein
LVLKQIVQFWKENYNGRNESRSEEAEDELFIDIECNEDRWKQKISVKTLAGKVILIRYNKTESHTLGGWIKHLLSNKERDINHQMFNFLFDGVTIADLKKRIKEIESKPIYSQRLVSTKILEDDECIPFDVVKYDIHLFDRLRGGTRINLWPRMGKITTQTTKEKKEATCYLVWKRLQPKLQTKQKESTCFAIWERLRPKLQTEATCFAVWKTL